MYVSGLATYLQKQGHKVMVIAIVPLNAFKDHGFFFQDEELSVVKYKYDEIDVIGVRLKDTNTTEIYSKFHLKWQYSWGKVLCKLDIAHWDILHTHAFIAATGEALIKAVKLHSSRVKVLASYHLPVSCVKETLIYANTMEACNVKPGINICTSCVMSTRKKIPVTLAHFFTSLMPVLKSEKIPTGFRIKYLVKEFLDSFCRIDKLIDVWHVFSNQIENILEQAGVNPEKIQVLRHGVNPVFLQNSHQHFRRKAPVIFLYASRFVQVKGFITLLKAWCSMPEDSSRLMYMVGNLQSANVEVEVWIKKASSRNDIRWLGEKTQQELANIIQEAHCVIVPSEWVEIGPLVFHEAIAAGSNIIASDLGGCRELGLLYSNACQLFRTGDVEQLANIIIGFTYRSSNYVPALQDENYQQVHNAYIDIQHKSSG